jgi:hypothetical protein
LPDAVFRVQFSRPPAALPQLFYRFSDVTPGEPPALPSIGATAEAHGALLLLRPVQALSHGRTYVIQASRDRVTWTESNTFAPDIALSDTEGHELTLDHGGIGNFRTPGTLLASIGSDMTPQLVTPAGIETPIVQLQVTDSTGDTQVARIAIASADGPALPVFMFLRREGGLGFGLPPATYFHTPANDPYMTTVYEPDRYLFRTVSLIGHRGAYLSLSTPNGAPPTAGHYEHPGAVMLYNLYPMPCATHAGYYDVREVAYAPDGTVTRLAVDFKHVCDGAAPVFGSYRLNSTVPVAN